MRSAPLVAISAVLLCSGACAPTLPSDPVPRALVRDVARVVDVRQKIGWVFDDVEAEAVLPDVLESACQVDQPNRGLALAWLDTEIARRGGSPVEAWRRAGKDLDQVQDLLSFVRARLVLARADQWVRDGKCPFWFEPNPTFDGVHVVTHRWILGAEAGGRLIVGTESGVVGYGAGGAGRVLVGYGLSERTTLFAGLEGGGGARFTNVPIGERATIPDFLATFAVPVVARFNFGQSAFVETEAGFMAYINQVAGRLEPGARAGAAIGGLVVRIKHGLLPRFSFAVTVDHAPGWNGRATVTQVSGGLKAGFDLSR